MADANSNAAAAAAHTKVIVGPTIQMGDGSYFDFAAPDASAMTIEDYAWGLAGNNRFRNQTRYRTEEGVGPRCLYNVAQHTVLLAEQLLWDGHGPAIAFEGLMHESDEVPWGDIPGPAKALMPVEFRALIQRAGDAIDHHFGVTHQHKVLIKQYDIRMLATEKRDLMPHAAVHQWEWTRGYEPFDFRILCWEPDMAAHQFIYLYNRLEAQRHG